MATTYTVTNDFTVDTTAVADDVDQNFTDILTGMNAFDAGNLASGTVPLARITGLTTTQIAAGTLVTEGEGINSSDNDTSIPTSAAVNDHLESHIGTGAFNPTAYAGEESITFPNGLILKHGSVSSITSNNTTTVTFAAAFPTGVVSVSVTPNTSSTSIDCYLGGTSTTSELTIVNQGSAVGAYWQVWGY